MRSAATLRLVAVLTAVAVLAGAITARILADAKSPPPSAGAQSIVAATSPVPPPASLLRARCFGAASADPARPCDNPGLQATVFPTPSRAAAAQRSSGCRRSFDRSLLRVCFWGTPVKSARRTVALIGDSHASHWRAALQDVVRAKHWRAISISRAACPLTLAQPDLPGVRRKRLCRAWNLTVQRWVAAHHSISVVFTGAHRGRVLPAPGLSPAATRTAGYALAWRRLLTHGGVRHIVVLRDTPRISASTLACVQRAARERLVAGTVCAQPRRFALPPDPFAEAARDVRSPRVQVADLSAFFCGPSVCPPVIGGALVLRDVSHMTTTFSATLGPYLLRVVNRLARTWHDGPGPGR